jgi:hypothetical protein
MYVFVYTCIHMNNCMWIYIQTNTYYSIHTGPSIESSPSIEMFSEMNHNEQLWDMITEISIKDMDRFLYLNGDFLRKLKNHMNNMCKKRKIAWYIYIYIWQLELSYAAEILIQKENINKSYISCFLFVLEYFLYHII